MPSLFLQLRTDDISLPDSLVFQSIIAQVLNVQEHLLLAMMHVLLPHSFPSASEATRGKVQGFLLRLPQSLAEMVVVLQLRGVVDEWLYLLCQVKLFSY